MSARAHERVRNRLILVEPTPEQIERARAEVWRRLRSRITERRQRAGWLRRTYRFFTKKSLRTR